jgi:hypothetical protein
MMSLPEFLAEITEQHRQAFPSQYWAESDGYVHAPQIAAAAEVLYSFLSGSTLWVVLIALMQSGKTGVVQASWWVVSALGWLLDGMVDKGNMYVITGLNSTDWKQQTIERLRSTFQSSTVKPRVLHNKDLQLLLQAWRCGERLAERERMSTRSLIVIDESHYGQDTDSVLDQFLTELGISASGNPEDYTGGRTAYVLSVSATPMSEAVADQVACHKRCVRLLPGTGYLHPARVFGRVRQSWKLTLPGGIARLLSTAVEKRAEFG